MDYKIYTKCGLLNESIGLREKGKEKIFTLFFEIKGLEFGVIYKPYYFGSRSPSHFSFYALTKGFEEFTGSGYRSIFVQSLGVASYAEIEEYIFKELKAAIPFLNGEQKALQVSLF